MICGSRVVDNYRFLGELDDPGGAMFSRVRFDTDEELVPTDFVFTVAPGATAELEAEIIRRLAAVAPAWTLGVRPLASVRDDYFRLKLLALLVFGSVAGFLILNVALGLFGVLWYSINQRRAEIGLRCAVGADAGRIGRQILGEALVLTTFGVILGLVIALQFPVLQVLPGAGVEVYGLAILGAATFLYLIVSVCAVYPSRLAARIQPAEALRAE
jgi:putative ABC transport system permease protein